jgi:RHH-type proline utilization regulon transcriptional repressor/proline dehydrogenase/delta 1-pyrroline-5-carboxylate dehydrogenase
MNFLDGLMCLCHIERNLAVTEPTSAVPHSPIDLGALRKVIEANRITDEDGAIRRLAAQADLSTDNREAISARAARLVRQVRGSSEPKLMEAFLAEYGLSTREGVALMCLAEALLRVPDAETVDELIRDKIAPHDWSSHSGASGSVFVNASTWALMLTGKVLDEDDDTGVERLLFGMVRRLGEPVIRRAVGTAMREMGDNFVLGRNIKEALKRGRTMTGKGYTYSFDMLGEAARTEADATRYFTAYENAIKAIAADAKHGDIRKNPGISVKLSALHPRYEDIKGEPVVAALSDRLLALCIASKTAGIGLNIDAEEADRLDMSLDIIERTLSADALAGWHGFGVVVQAYGPRAAFVIDWLHALATKLDRKIMVRLVKGAYWDAEIKRAQTFGLDGFPVFTRKANTDVSYMGCARSVLTKRDRIYPQFATHNAHTVAAILAMAGNARDDFEFQRLHGMGDALHHVVMSEEGTQCRIYAPVGAHEDLLAYLVRRLLENGANSSFVHQIVDEEVAPETIARDPLVVADRLAGTINTAIRLPDELFAPERKNSNGFDLTERAVRAQLDVERGRFEAPHLWNAHPLLADGQPTGGNERTVINPAKLGDTVGTVHEADAASVDGAVGAARLAQPDWARTPASERAAILNAVADLYEANTAEFIALATREAGKTVLDGIAEIREAVDFLRYYAANAGTVERDTQARGVIVCISPWNFPLAIFTGQIAAALATGNAVIAKPAEQTALIAFRAVEMMHEAGVPRAIIQLLPGDGAVVGAPLTAHRDIDGVCFTGSGEVARLIERALAVNARPDAMLIAETGGLNAMIVDSTALPEQAVRDILASSFQSAGQRCSALRVLYVQEDVADRLLTMLKGAMATLEIGDPWHHASDVGPLIDAEAVGVVGGHIAKMAKSGQVLHQLDVHGDGRFVPPTVVRIKGIADLDREIFGPVLHVATFAADEIDAAIDAINASGYGLTFGLHTRIDARVQHVINRIEAGNIYVNRNQIGAVVGSQPFGGEGLSGTGPKAGGPHYLRRFRMSGGGTKTKALPSALPGISPSRGETTSFTGVNAMKRVADPIPLLRKALRGKAASAVATVAALDQGPIDLPGPTGEANTLILGPRGTVLCLGPDEAGLLEQVVIALGAGNRVVAVGPGAARLVAALAREGLPVVGFDEVVDPETVSLDGWQAVAWSGDAAGLCVLRKRLAAQSGPIVPLVDEGDRPVAFCVERAICVDTTAAGGNASLLAEAS